MWRMTTQIDLIRSYDGVATRWRTKIEGLGYAAAYRWLVAHTKLDTDGKTMLDAGCGTADFARAVIEVAGPPKYTTLLDPSANMVATAQRSLQHLTPNIRPVVAGLEVAAPRASDIVLCAHVIELDHLDAVAPQNDRTASVKKPPGRRWAAMPLGRWISCRTTEQVQPRLSDHPHPKDSQMIYVEVDFTVAEEQHAMAISALTAEAPPIRALSGNLGVRVLTDPNTAGAVTLLHQWTDLPRLDHYRNGPLFAQIGGMLRPMMTEAPNTNVYEVQELT